MRPLSGFSALLLLFLVISLVDARTDPGEYWKNIMKGETMPKAIHDLLHHQDLPGKAIDKQLFIKDFDIKPNAIIYHSHVDPKEVEPFFKPEAEKSANPVG